MAQEQFNRTCRICYKDLGIYARWNQKYCGNPACKRAGELARDRVNRQKRAMHRPEKDCRRCKRKFQVMDDGNKYYCKYCVGITTKGDTYHKCMDCGAKINLLKKRCYKCAEIAKTSKVRAHNKRVTENIVKTQIEAKLKGITNKKPQVDPKWTQPQGSKRKGK